MYIRLFSFEEDKKKKARLLESRRTPSLFLQRLSDRAHPPAVRISVVLPHSRSRPVLHQALRPFGKVEFDVLLEPAKPASQPTNQPTSLSLRARSFARLLSSLSLSLPENWAYELGIEIIVSRLDDDGSVVVLSTARDGVDELLHCLLSRRRGLHAPPACWVVDPRRNVVPHVAHLLESGHARSAPGTQPQLHILLLQPDQGTDMYTQIVSRRNSPRGPLQFVRLLCPRPDSEALGR